jgi:hypothetical protein
VRAQGIRLDKQALVNEIVKALLAELENYARSARSAHAEATDEQSKAENKYDTRGLEASYLARGQSRQAQEVLQSLAQYRALPVRDFSVQDAIDLGALVVVKMRDEAVRYFIGPSAGGTEITCEGETVVVITPQSPLGQRLVGRKSSEFAKGKSVDFRVTGVE